MEQTHTYHEWVKIMNDKINIEIKTPPLSTEDQRKAARKKLEEFLKSKMSKNEIV